MIDIPVTRATDFLVVYGADEQREYERCDTLEEAKAAYQEPPMGWTSLGICACQGGLPFLKLDLVLTFGRKPVQIHRPNDVVSIQ